jgi:hypothetical protein
MVEAGLAVVYGFCIRDLDRAWYVCKECEEKFHDVPDTIRRLNEIRRHLEQPMTASVLHLFGHR